MSNWFQKLGFGLKKTSTRLTSGITDIFIKRKVDSQTLEELEDLLITSDLGVKAAQKIISSFASRRLNKDADEQEIKTELANDIETILNPCEQPFLITKTLCYFNGWGQRSRQDHHNRKTCRKIERQTSNQPHCR